MARIKIIHNSSLVEDDDVERAIAAAEDVFAFYGTSAKAAFSEFEWQRKELGFEQIGGLAEAWTEANKAADLALTEGWTNPGSISCEISIVDCTDTEAEA